MTYNNTTQVQISFEDTIARVTEALAAEGFGILNEIDVQATMKKKLDVEYDRYIILGACNPTFAHRALQAEYEIGLMLPCNVIVYEKDDSIFVSAIMPTVAMGMIDNDELQSIAEQVETKLTNVINTVKK